MTRITYMGDEAHAAAWRLLGVAAEVLTPDVDMLCWLERKMTGTPSHGRVASPAALAATEPCAPATVVPGEPHRCAAEPDACESPDLILLTPAAAARLPAAAPERLQRAVSPLLLVLPEASALAAGSDLARRVRAQLGMAS